MALRLVRAYSGDQPSVLETAEGIAAEPKQAAAAESHRRWFDVSHPETISRWEADERRAHANGLPLELHWFGDWGPGGIWGNFDGVIYERPGEGWRALLRRHYITGWLEEANYRRVWRRSTLARRLPREQRPVASLLDTLDPMARQLWLRECRRKRWRARLHPPWRLLPSYLLAEWRWRRAGRPEWPRQPNYRPWDPGDYSFG